MKNFFLIGLLAILLTGELAAQEWLTDFAQAKDIASKENKKIVLVFQGSDWCAPCIKLDQDIWSSEEFKTYSKDHFIMLKADFPKRKKNALTPEQQEKNNKLAESYNKGGYFPFVLVLNAKGEVLGSTGYKKMNVHDFINHLNSFK
jgi:thioredoxin-related protein